MQNQTPRKKVEELIADTPMTNGNDNDVSKQVSNSDDCPANCDSISSLNTSSLLASSNKRKFENDHGEFYIRIPVKLCNEDVRCYQLVKKMEKFSFEHA